MCIEQEVRIAEEPARVFRCLTEEVDSWWDKRSFGGYLTLDVFPGGLFVEKRAGSFVTYAMVDQIEPPFLLILSGPMGMTPAVVGRIVFRLRSEQNETVLSLSHDAFGFLNDEVFSSYARGWNHLLQDVLVRYLSA